MVWDDRTEQGWLSCPGWKSQPISRALGASGILTLSLSFSFVLKNGSQRNGSPSLGKTDYLGQLCTLGDRTLCTPSALPDLPSKVTVSNGLQKVSRE